jgi:polysaccharide deacetylase 2 family uncharacterized protein YibQ
MPSQKNIIAFSLSSFALLSFSGYVAGVVSYDISKSQIGKQVAVLPIDIIDNQILNDSLNSQNDGKLEISFGERNSDNSSFSNPPPQSYVASGEQTGGNEVNPVVPPKPDTSYQVIDVDESKKQFESQADSRFKVISIPDETELQTQGNSTNSIENEGLNNENPMVIDLENNQVTQQAKTITLDSVTAKWSKKYGNAVELNVAPNEDLIAVEGKYILPKPTAKQKPMDYYASNIEVNKSKPAISVVVGGLGMDVDLTKKFIEETPPNVTLGFVPYAENLQQQISAARELGHEVVLELPLEPYDYPRPDVGEQVLLTSLTPQANAERLDWLMSRFQGYSGVMNYLGAKFFTDDKQTEEFLKRIKKRGVYFVETETLRLGTASQSARNVGLPHATSTRTIDTLQNYEMIKENLKAVEEIAQKNKKAIAVGYATPETLSALKTWLDETNIQIAPVSKVVK